MRAAVLLACAAAMAVLMPAPSLHAQGVGVDPMTIHSRPISHFRIGSPETRFGPFEFVGGLEMTSPARDFGGMSALRFLTPGRDFIGVADTGFWFFGRLVHDEDGRPAGMADFRMQPIVDVNGAPTREKWMTDAEGLAVRGGVATVGFERAHRIAQYEIAPEGMGAAFRDIDFLVPSYELRTNRGFETVAHALGAGPLSSALVVVAERSIDTKGNIFAAVLSGPRAGVFTVARHDDFDITDGAFLPDGDLLLLERRFSMAIGVAMRLRRIEAETIGAGLLADGPVLLEADMGYQIDNMEALDVWRRGDGATMISLMSDDNHSLLQRNLYLEFELVGE